MSISRSTIAIFIDGVSLHLSLKTLGFEIDYKRLLSELQTRGALLRAFYYTAVIQDQEYSSIRQLIDWLDYNGYTVVTKAAKEYMDASGRRRVKRRVAVELTVDAMEIAPHIDEMILFSGDGDLRYLVQAMQRRSIRVTVASAVSTQPSIVADELRRQATSFLDLREMQIRISRESLYEKPARV